MSFWDNVKKFAQPYDDEDYDDYDEELDEFEEPAQEPAPRTRRPSPFATTAAPAAPAAAAAPAAPAASTPSFGGQVLNMSSGKQEVVLFHAKTFDDAAKAADELCKRKAVILNMENVDKALTRRVVDFLSGAVYALDGRVKKVAQSTYLFCPHNMDVTGDLENIKAEAESYI
ncbi:MAG: cell division protein SepF [Oscillospiraceae bacterium]|jgi:cell division inhibitor SepF|nr:cell division protein SepF [Oscillospiraceae bacterium]